MKETNLDAQLCHQCRGRCCHGHPGLWSEPKRFFGIFAQDGKATAAQLATILRQNNLELRDLDGVLIPAPLKTDHGCIALRENGCSYPLNDRPGQCLALTPNLETLLDDRIHCTMPADYGSGRARDNWRPYQNLLQATRRFISPDGTLTSTNGNLL